VDLYEGALDGPKIGTSLRTASLIAGLLSAAFGVLSTVMLIRGTARVQWNIQTFNGQSDAEKAFLETTQWYRQAGLVALGAAFLCSAASSIASYLDG
jgi:hypothetical protein